ncbi:asparagine synthase-related protein [Parasphingopyxis sp.]|uniref:asparagine synthase-related protein n=1 Tax=Parasphingopyxis sp. TaxID=1920299 RepID=UPI002622537C|nr:asparagine synthase-related protein [Parasphingopyxis sp.]
MTALFLVRNDDESFAGPAIADARAEFAQQGFDAMEELAIPGWRLLHAPYIQGGPVNFLQAGEDFIGFAGSFVFDGKIGKPALEAALKDLDPVAIDWSRVGGQFVMVVRKSGQTFLFTDWFGAFEIYHDADRRIFSTSLLAAVSCLPKLSFYPQGVYEHVFNVLPIGDDTVFNELKRLGPFEVVELGQDGAASHPIEKPMQEGFGSRDTGAHIEAQREALGRAVRPWVEHFGDRIFCALSGGLDSRLALALLREQNILPSVFCYGAEDECDVRVAREICAALGTEVDVLDKDVYREVALDAFPAQVERNFYDHDGLPNFGSIFDNGADYHARKKRHTDGALSVSGGCGEVFRNFFFLPDGRFTAADVARAFYARYSLGDVTETFDERAFLRGIEDKILAGLGREGDRGALPRAAVERIYPTVRCRSLFGHEISLEARQGAYLMPFLEQLVVAQALKLPLSMKNAGRFEAALLAAIDPELAAMPSCYGHDFSGPPGLRHRFSEWTTRRRPIALRHRSYAIQRRLGPMGDEHGGLETDAYLRRVIDLDYPIMRRFFRIGEIGDSAVMRRIANLEYLGQRLGSKLRG